MAVILYLLPDLLAEENPKAHEASQLSLPIPPTAAMINILSTFRDLSARSELFSCS